MEILLGLYTIRVGLIFFWNYVNFIFLFSAIMFSKGSLMSVQLLKRA